MMIITFLSDLNSLNHLSMKVMFFIVGCLFFLKDQHLLILTLCKMHHSFAIVDKENKVDDPSRGIVLRKVRKRTWEVLDDFGESVLDTVEDTGTRVS